MNPTKSSHTVEFRTATSDDAAIISDLARHIWTDHYAPIVGEAQVEYMLSEVHGKNEILADMKDGLEYEIVWDKCTDQPRGYFAYGVKKPAQKILLSKIYLHEELRGLGVGFRIISQLVNKAACRQCDRIYLHVNRENTIAISAYRKWGFVITGEIVRDIGDGYVMDDYEMELPVSSP